MTRRVAAALLFTAAVLFPFLVNFAPFLLERVVSGQELPRSWQGCAADVVGPDAVPSAAETCRWSEAPMPGKLPAALAAGGRTVLLRARVPTPPFCAPWGAACSVLFGTISDPADAFLNGRHIGRVGEPGPTAQYAQTYPGRFFAPASLWRVGADNEVLLALYPFGGGTRGVLRGPAGVYRTRGARLLDEAVTAGTVFLPLFCAFALFTIVFLVVGASGPDEEQPRFLRPYVAYCLLAALYLVSLSRLPREYLPQPVGYSVHFGVRFLYEMCFVWLVCEYFDAARRVSRVVQALLGAFALACFATAFDGARGGELVAKLSRNGVGLFPYTAALGLYLSLRGGRRSDRAAAALFACVLVMQVSDVLALWGALPDVYFGRFYPLIVGMVFGLIYWGRLAEQRRRMEVAARVGQLAAQVSHDIRSPLAALDAVEPELDALPEETRVVLRAAFARIRDIAERLLDRQRLAREGRRSVEVLSGLLDKLLAEKRARFRARPELELLARVEPAAALACAEVEPVELERALSNLVDNAAEAVIGPGTVELGLRVAGERVELSVRDTGKGIAAELLPRLGREGETHGKEGGHGLGLHQARQAVERCGGTLSLSSEQGRGTTATLSLPAARPPAWLATELGTSPGAEVVVLDDDASVHGVWRRRLGGRARHFESAAAFEAWWRSAGRAAPGLILLDHELGPEAPTGLDLVEALGLEPARCVLVTSRFEEPAVRERCRRLGVRLLPKAMAGVVAIAT